jgi:hypothetical protein
LDSKTKNRITPWNEFIFETPLAHESGGPGELIDEKTEGRKSRDTLPLTCKLNVSKSLKYAIFKFSTKKFR